MLYVDAANHVSALWPTGGLSNRLGFNETAKVGVQIVAGTAMRGREELIVIAVPARDGAARSDLTALADPARSRAVSDAVGSQPDTRPGFYMHPVQKAGW